MTIISDILPYLIVVSGVINAMLVLILVLRSNKANRKKSLVSIWSKTMLKSSADKKLVDVIANDSAFVCRLLQNIHQGICIIDTAWDIRYMNSDLLDMLGLPKDTVQVTNLSQWITPESFDTFRNHQSSPHEKLLEIIWKRSDGELVYTNSTPQQLVDKDGNVQGWFNLVVDMSDQQKRAELIQTKNLLLEESEKEHSEELLQLTIQLEEKNSSYKYIEREMQKKNIMLENILTTAEIFILLLDRQGNINLINRKGCSILGYNEEELLGENWFDVCLPRDGKRHFFQSAFNELIQGKGVGSLSYESYVLTKNGKTRLLSWQNSLLYDQNQNVIGVLRTGTDITNQKRIIEELQKSEEKYRRLVDNSIAGIFQSTIEGDLLYVNPAMPAIFGFPDQCEMLKLERKFFNENISDNGRIIPPLQKEGRLHNYELTVQTKQGNKREIIVNAVLNRGVITGMVIDNTEIKLTAAKLREREQQLTALFEQAADPMYLLNKEGKFIDVNPQACRDLGYTRDELLSFYVADIDDEYKTRENEVWFWEKLPRNKSVAFEVRLKHKTGRRIPVEIKLTRYETADNFLIFAMGRNLTERKKAEREIKIREERYWTLLESMSDAVYMLDNGYNYLIVNSTACKSLGKGRDELVGNNMLHLFPDIKDTAFHSTIKSVIKTGQPSELTEHYLDNEGNMCWAFLRVFSVPDGILCVSSDITKVKSAELQLFESKERLQVALDASQIGTWVWDLTDDTMQWDERMCQIFDVKSSNSITLSQFLSLISDEDTTRIREEMEEVVKLKLPFNSDFRLKNSEYIFHEINVQGRVLIDENGSTNKMYGVCMDITDRKISEQALKDSEEKFKRIFTTIQDGYLLISITGEILSVNPATTQLLGYSSAKELTGNSFQNILQHHQDAFSTLLLILEEEDEVSNYQLELLKKSDETMITECNLHLVKENDRAVAIEGTFRDSTERIWIEEALKSSLNLNKIMANYSVQEMIDYGLEEAVRLTRSEIGFFHFVDEASGNISLQTWSQNTRSFCEVPDKIEHYPIESAGIWADCIRKRKPLIHNDYLASAINGGLPDGHFPLAREIVSPIFENDSIVAVIGVGNKKNLYNQFDLNQLLLVAENIWSIIRRKKAEDDLILARDTAEKANKSKSIFLANMSHEIRTPLNAVIGFADILHDQIIEPRHKNYLESIKTSGRTLLRLINDILDLSKIEAGKLLIQPEPTNVSVIVKELEHIFTLRAQQKKLKFICEVDSEVSSNLLIDELRIRQILLNLIGNAIKFTSRGYVSVKVFRTDKSESELTCDLCFEVKDSGIGIPKESHESIFESFQQQEDQDMRRYGGTGLGLAITKRLVDLMGGTISLKSQPELGSTFSVEFKNVRISKLERKVHPDFTFDHIQFSKSILLLVDDVESNRDLVLGYLRDTKIEIIEATNGQEAVDLANKYKPDLILMDIRMPLMDGYQASKLIRELPGLEQVPIVAITASISSKDRMNMGFKRFDGLLKKPVSRSQLFEELTEFLPFQKISAIDTHEQINQNGFQLPSDEKITNFLNEFEPYYVKMYPAVLEASELETIGTFFMVMGEFAQKNDLHNLIAMTNLANEYIESFDIANLRFLMDKMPDELEQLKQKISD